MRVVLAVDCHTDNGESTTEKEHSIDTISTLTTIMNKCLHGGASTRAEALCVWSMESEWPGEYKEERASEAEKRHADRLAAAKASGSAEPIKAVDEAVKLEALAGKAVAAVRGLVKPCSTKGAFGASITGDHALDILRVDGKSLLTDAERALSYGLAQQRAHDAATDRLWEMCTPAGFGDLKAHATRIDTSVRDGRTLPKEHVISGILEDEHISEAIRELLCERWGSEEDLELKFKALNMYRDGGKFSTHVDTPHAGLVGTIVVLLPLGDTQVEGGELCVQRGATQEVVPATRSCPTVTLLPACAPHSVAPVTAGTRVSVTYEVFLTRAVPNAAEPSTGAGGGAGGGAGVGSGMASTPSPLVYTEALSKAADELADAIAASDRPGIVCMLPTMEAYTLPTIYDAIQGPGLMASLHGLDRLLANAFTSRSDLHCSVSVALLHYHASERRGYDWDPEDHFESESVGIQCASKLSFDKPSALQVFHEHTKMEEFVFPKLESAKDWTGGFLVVRDGNEPMTGMTGNCVDTLEGIENQVYFCLVLCITPRTNPVVEHL